jgi:hypothetical protein
VADHFRILCKNVGITNFGSKNKFECRKMLANFLDYQKRLDAHGLYLASNVARITSTICRAVNVVYGEEFMDAFLAVNDCKSRMDHETARTYQDFWIHGALAHNACIGSLGVSDDGSHSSAPDMLLDPNCRLVNEDEDNIHLINVANDWEINISSVVQFDTTEFRNKILNLFKIWRIIQENETISGTHDNEPWNFVETAMAKIPNSAFTKSSVHYSYKRYESVPDIDA